MEEIIKALKGCIHDDCDNCKYYLFDVCNRKQLLKDTVDVLEKTNSGNVGVWKDTIGSFECSICHIPQEYVSAYCPSCGAKMRDEVIE